MLSFGDQDDCEGELVGQPHQGLACMFHMMNEARIGVGMGAVMYGYRGYLASLQYARERLQGRPPAAKDPLQPQVPLVAHADVRRMLLAQKAYVEGAFALGLYAARLVDEQRTGTSEAARAEAGLLLDLLTPIVKSWPAQWCLEANSLAIQIHGGYGYTREYPVEQFWRDNRLNMIHEGTHGIQALDLLGRKAVMQQGAAIALFGRTLQATVEQARARPALPPMPRRCRRPGARCWPRWPCSRRCCAAMATVRWPTPACSSKPSATPCWPGPGCARPWWPTARWRRPPRRRTQTSTAASCRPAAGSFTGSSLAPRPNTRCCAAWTTARWRCRMRGSSRESE